MGGRLVTYCNGTSGCGSLPQFHGRDGIVLIIRGTGDFFALSIGADAWIFMHDACKRGNANDERGNRALEEMSPYFAGMLKRSVHS